MVTAFVLAMSFWISLIDIRDHRIYNRDLLIFALPLALDTRSVSSQEVILFILIALITTSALRIGGGDFKLISLLLITHGEVVANTKYLEHLFFVLLLSLVISTLYRRNLRGAIPLAPAILLPFILGYLGI